MCCWGYLVVLRRKNHYAAVSLPLSLNLSLSYFISVHFIGNAAARRVEMLLFCDHTICRCILSLAVKDPNNAGFFSPKTDIDI